MQPSGAELERLRGRLLQAVGGACPRWLAGQEEDLVQTAMLRLLPTLQRDGNRDLSAMYLAKVAHGLAVDEIRRRCRRKEVSAESVGAIARRPAEVADPERVSESREIGEAIRECLGRLVRPRRLAVVLYLQGCTVPESARRLRWSLTKTENLVYRGLANLRRCLAGKEVTP
jgi:RNA polymerase sigma-70 factor (ECF subfamily)